MNPQHSVAQHAEAGLPPTGDSLFDELVAAHRQRARRRKLESAAARLLDTVDVEHRAEYRHLSLGE